MITVLYPIYNIYESSTRIKAFNASINELDPRFNILISDSGKQSSLSCIKTDKNFRYYHNYQESAVFNKSFTINKGAEELQDDVFIILDAEILMDPLLYDKLIPFIAGKTYFVGITQHYHCEKPFKSLTYKGLRKEIEATTDPKSFKFHDYKPGRFIFTNKKSFKDAGGFDETYIGYGGHDYGFLFEYILNTKGPVYCLNQTDIHIYHENNRREEEKSFLEENEVKWGVLCSRVTKNYFEFAKEYYTHVEL